jgi:vacuolar-type H+-ATPase subunit H
MQPDDPGNMLPVNERSKTLSSRVATIELSPLDQIRQAEAEVARRIAAAHQAAEVAVNEAQAQAQDLAHKARKAGHREGQAQYQETISRAKDRAHELVAQAHDQAEDLHCKGELRMEAAARRALAIVIGWPEGADDA